MNILHVTDSHGTVKTPESRNDLYYITFLRKLYELSYIIKKEKIDMILHTGDLFHTSRVSNKFMGQVAEIIKLYNVPFYVVPGNHDIDGYTIETIDQTSLGLLNKTGVLKILDRDNPLRITINKGTLDEYEIAISGQEYYKNIDSGIQSDYEMQQPEADFNILAIHGYLADTPQHPDIKCTYPKDVITDADVVLSGHYHRQFFVDCGDTSYYNPGSMLRVEMTDYNKKHMPQYGILKIDLDNTGCIKYDYTFHQFRCAKPSNIVFDYASKAIVKTHGITLENFTNSISNTMQNINVNTGISPITIIRNIANDYVKNNPDASDLNDIQSLLSTYYNNSFANQIDNDIVSVKGYIPAKDFIKIKTIEIENFQSHENTVINLSDGLNIFVGETSNGKTSIIRAINWVVNNQPLGTNFIMTGKTYARVKITYDNGAYIERYRDLKNTGYYEVWDGDVNTTPQKYQGFTNNVPIEVTNIHQMPKINVTKNLETHLNMMSQLERPFLITESVNDKATAIGKITGTDIIDNAISEARLDTVANNKLVTSHSKRIAEIKDNMSTNYDLPALNKEYQELEDDIKKLDYLYNHYNNLLHINNDLNNINIEINNLNLNIINYNSIINNKPNIFNIESLLNKLQTLIDIKRSCDSINNSILLLNNQEELYCNIILNKDDVLNTELKLNSLKQDYNIKTKYNSILTNINSLEQKMIIINSLLSLKPIIINIMDLSNQVNSYITIHKKYLMYDIENKTLSNRIEVNNNMINNLKQEISNINTTRKEYVLSIGICPCCNQTINENNIDTIINNFYGG